MSTPGTDSADVRDAAGHADPRTTRRYDRARHNLDKHPTYALPSLISAVGAWLSGSQEPDRRVRAFKTIVITLLVEAVVIAWLSTQGVHALNVEWVHWL